MTERTELTTENLVEYISKIYKYLKEQAEVMGVDTKPVAIVSPIAYKEIERIMQEQDLTMEQAYWRWMGLI